MTSKSTSTETQSTPITITRTFNLPINILWKAWSDEETLQKWWGPINFTCPYCTIDFAEGGKYLSCMQGKDGNEMWSTGVYKEIIPQERIVMTDSFSDKKGNIIPASEVGMPGNWPLECIVSLEFEELENKTKLTLLHDGIPTDMHEDCIKGWQQCFDKLESAVK